MSRIKAAKKVDYFDIHLELIEGLPHTIKVPLRKFIEVARLNKELLDLKNEVIVRILQDRNYTEVMEKIRLKEQELNAL